MAVMGNHEFNAIAWATRDERSPDHYLRQRHDEKGQKNRRQHAAFLAEVGEESEAHRDWVTWFAQLPLWIEKPSFRVVHACWSPKHIDVLQQRLGANARLTPEAIQQANEPEHALYVAVETVLKGVEVQLPDSMSFLDEGGHTRHEIRTKWWDRSLTSYRDAYIGPAGFDIPSLPMPDQVGIPEPDRPIFIGHYWLDPEGGIRPLSRRVACVDYSVARRGPLVAYRFDGEPELTADKFAWVAALPDC